jgi:hypothetical protein
MGELEQAEDYFRRAFFVVVAIGRREDALASLDRLEAIATRLGAEDRLDQYRSERRQLESGDGASE